MLWFFLALAAAFFDALYFVLIKRFLQKMDFYTLGAGVSLFSFLLTITISMLKGLPQLGGDFLPFLILTGAMETVAMILYFRALESGDISLSMPMLSFTPLFLIFTSYAILGELPGRFGGAGIFLIVIGSYFLGVNEIKNDGGDPLLPFKELLRKPGPRNMLIVAVFWGFETNFVKIVVQNSDPVFAAAGFSLVIGAAFTALSAVKGEPILTGLSANKGSFIAAGVVVSLSAIAINQAFTMQIVPYVISIKRLTILFSVFFGWLVFGETNITSRMTGALIMTLGSIIILIS